MNNTKNLYTMPVLPTRGLVLFPGSNINFDVGRTQSLKALEEASKNHTNIFIVSQTDPGDASVTTQKLCAVGTIARISQVMHMPDNVTRIIASGICRAYIREILSETPYISAAIEEAEPLERAEPVLEAAYTDMLKKKFKAFLSLNPRLSGDTFRRAAAEEDPEILCSTIASVLDMDLRKKQELLEITNIAQLSETLLALLSYNCEIIELEKKISVKVRGSMDKNQRDYFLREQIRAINEELGEKDGAYKEAEVFRSRLDQYNITGDSREKLLKDISRFEYMPLNSSESNVIRSYLETVFDLPWTQLCEEAFNIGEVRNVLNADHYGLEKVKDRILEYLAVRHFTHGKVSTVLCLFGPPGVGKTSVARSVARALNRKYVRISLGGIHDEADIRGHRKTYLGAMEGRIIAAMREAKVKNPVILLDEIDKMGSDYKGDPASALLEVLDYEQNRAFRDHYLEIPFDLSQVLFITTANTLETISRPLLDRMEIIELSGYTQSEKFNIAKQYLIKKSLDKNGLSDTMISIDDDAVKEIIDYYTREAGVRKLEQLIDSLCRKGARAILESGERGIHVTADNLAEYLGKKRYHFDMMNEAPQIGISRGLAWTSVGGETLSIEVNVMNGTGKTELTGKLGDVMKESAMTAISFIRSVASDYGIDKSFYKEKDIHIHVPEGAVPKDGPSAGITMALAVISALSERPVRSDVAMTGEITLRGRVLPIGGLKEKTLAAYRAGIRTVIIPDENKADIADIPKDVADEIKFIPVKSAQEVFDIALV